MANEATVQCSLQLRKGNLDYQSRPSTFRADVATAGGPTPGTVTCTTAGANIDLSQLTQPGLCRIQNLDDTNFVSVGLFYIDGGFFLPVLELLPGESFIFRLSRHLSDEFSNDTGTGPDSASNTLHIKTGGGTCKVLVEAFEA